ncbi:MAG: heme-binding protein [Steroidobacteraceae bacterium]|jgi:uncharacterized protein GlcG (DUF336 family)
MSQRIRLGAMLCVMAFVTAAVAQAPPPEVKPARGPSASLALEGAQAAIAACAAQGYLVAVTVIDSAGELKVVIAADGVPPGHAVPHSALKAQTALAYRISSAQVQERTKTDAAFAAEIEANAKLLARAGGQPLLSHGEIIGAIGVSGAPGGDKDDACTSAGVAKIRERL